MRKISVAIHGFGNIGKNVLEALEASSDMVCVGVIRRPDSVGTALMNLRGIQDFGSLNDLVIALGEKPTVAILCTPSRETPTVAAAYLKAEINTVDSFDIHAEIPQVVELLDSIAKKAGRASIIGAGWDPGTDSVFRALFEAMAPIGTTFTNFGRGRSLGHSVAARAIAGVADATSITIPMGGGRHSRLVYVLPMESFKHDSIKAAIATDPYFSRDPLDVRFVTTKEELAAVADNSHAVLMERTGASGLTSNQQLSFEMHINNPALTAQVLVSCARAATRLTPGSHTLIDIPPVAMLPGDRMKHITRLV